MPFTKQDVKAELREFMCGFARSVERVYGMDTGGALLGFPGKKAWDVAPENAQIEESPLWGTVMSMYDYGIEGIVPFSQTEALVDGPEADVEMFFLALDTETMRLYLNEDEVRVPRLSMRTVQTAIARVVLDGGERYTTLEDQQMAGYLSIYEVALLADIDERSVRNAANPKLPEPLITKSFGRRTLVDIHDARRWLLGRKGYVPTKHFTPPVRPETGELTEISLPSDVRARFESLASQANVSSWDLLTQLLDRHEREMAGKEGNQ